MKSQYGKQVGVWVAAFNKRDADEMDFEDGMGMGMGMGGMYPMGMNPMMMGMYGMGGMPPMGGGAPPVGGGEPGNPMGMGGMYGGGMGGMNPMMMGGMNPMMMGMGMGMGGDTNNLNVVGSPKKPLRVVCKAIDLQDINPTANITLKKVLVDNLKISGLFDYNETKWGPVTEDENVLLEDVKADKAEENKARLKTLIFGIDIVLKEPIALK